MALTEIKTGAIADDAVTTDKLANAINTERTANTAKATNATHTGEVTGSGALTITADAVTGAKIADDAVAQEHIADEAVDEARLQISNAGSNGQFLQKQSGNTGGLTWASVSSTPEGTAILSTGESGGSKFLREDGDGSCSWQPVSAFVTGMIMMWSGTIATIPSGWVLCNGSNSTPDLRDKFIVGAKEDDSSVAKTNVTGSLTQTGGAATDSITISISGNTGNCSAGNGNQDGVDGAMAHRNHTHSFSGSGSATVDTLPPYYALAFIMKT